VSAITLLSGSDNDNFTEALTDNYLKMRIPGKLESNRWVEVLVQRAEGEMLDGRLSRIA
jgi:hypothetical protein